MSQPSAKSGIMATSSQCLSSAAHRGIRRTCVNCALSELCVPVGLDQKDMERLDQLVDRQQPLPANAHLCRVGERFSTLYAVRSGCFKSYRMDREGRERVLAFHLPGELMGLDAIYPGVYQSNIVALDVGGVCALPYNDLSHLAAQIPRLQEQIFRLLSKDLSAYAWLGGDHSAEERVAGFLLDLSNRYRERGYSDRAFNLAMPRRDIANYLRLATETVSRVITRFEREGLIRTERREVQLLDLEGLNQRANHCLQVTI
jgi:CRP/FNR family transcriptional regulator